MNRRAFLAGAVGLAALGAGRAFGGQEKKKLTAAVIGAIHGANI